MVDKDIEAMYDQVLEYLRSKQTYYLDASMPDKEFVDTRDFDLTSAVDTIQRQVRNIPSLGEAATVKGYRTMRSATSEYDIRRMTRSEYWIDAALEEQDNIDKWSFNKKLVRMHMNSKDAGS